MPPCVPACQLVRNLACSPALLPTCVAAYLPDCLPFVFLSLYSVCQSYAILDLNAPLIWPLRHGFNVFLCFVDVKPGANAIPMSAC